MTMKYLLIAASLLLIGCTQKTPVLLPTDPVCVNACKVMSAFDCPESEPSQGGKTCEQVCEYVSKTSMQPECIVRSESIESVRACGVKCAR